MGKAQTKKTKGKKAMWSYSMLGWYENREVKVELPESLQIETFAMVCEQDENEETQGY